MIHHLFPISCVLMALAVGAGAFGAHGLKEVVTPERLDVWQTAVFYQMTHALTLLIIAVTLKAELFSVSVLQLPSMLFLSGIIIFSGSLYLLVLTNTGWLGAITPIGGTLLIAAWVLLAVKSL